MRRAGERFLLVWRAQAESDAALYAQLEALNGFYGVVRTQQRRSGGAG